MTDTIFALATPPGRGAIAIIRLSGPGTDAVLASLGAPGLQPRLAALRSLTHDNQTLDQALVLRFPAPKSYTGEDCAELHLHGGRAVVETTSRALIALGLRPAEPGEFTRRAFQNGRMDLAQAEAVADLIDAETAAQAHQALAQLDGALSRTYAGFRRDLLKALALVEAEIDFPDEEVPDNLARTAGILLDQLIADLKAALADAHRGERVRNGYRIVLIGETNAGKSSLFNALIAREAAIVTDIAGTTRDVLDADLVIGGYAVTLSDTAGLRDTNDPIEAEGVRRARTRAVEADLRLWVRAPGDPPGVAADYVQPSDLVVWTKSDLGTMSFGAAAAPTRSPPRSDPPPSSGREGTEPLPPAPGAVSAQRRVGAAPHVGPLEALDSLPVSTITGDGLDRLHHWIAQRLAQDLTGTDFPAVTRERHRRRLSEALKAVEAAHLALARGPEIAAEDLRRASSALAQVAGSIGVEDILGEVFSTFCIGK